MRGCSPRNILVGMYAAIVLVSFQCASSEVATAEPVRYVQRTLHLEGLIKAPADATWKLMTNWGAVMTWWKAVPGTPPALLKSCDLVKGYTEQQLPRVRRCVIDTTQLAGRVPPEVADPNYKTPDYIDETLLDADSDAKYLIYKYSANFHPGSTTIQIVDEGPCLSRFIIKYTNLERENDASAAKIRRAESHIGDAFGETADYRGVKYYLEKQWAGRAPCT